MMPITGATLDFRPRTSTNTGASVPVKTEIGLHNIHGEIRY